MAAAAADDDLIDYLGSKLGGTKASVAKRFAKDAGLADDFADFIANPRRGLDHKDDDDDDDDDGDVSAPTTTKKKKKKKKQRISKDADTPSSSKRPEATTTTKQAEGAVVEEGALKKTNSATTTKWVPPSRRGSDDDDGEKLLRSRVTGALNKASDATVEACAMEIVECYESSPATRVNELLAERVLRLDPSKRRTLGPTYAALVACCHFGGNRDAGCVVLDAALLEREEDFEKESSFFTFAACLCEVGLVDGVVAVSLCEGVAEKARWDLAFDVITVARESMKNDCPVRLSEFADKASGVGATPRETHFRRAAFEAITGKKKRTDTDKERWRTLRAAVKRSNRGLAPVAVAKNLEWNDLLRQKGLWWKRIGRYNDQAQAQAQDDDPVRRAQVEKNKKRKKRDGDPRSAVEALAAERRMSTPARRAAFVALTGASDADDARRRCARLLAGKAADEREVATVAVHCCLVEDRYNPFYGTFCALWTASATKAEAKARTFALKLAIWTALKSLGGYDRRQIANLGKLVVAMHPATLAVTVSCAGVAPEVALKSDDAAIFLATVLRGVLQRDDLHLAPPSQKKETTRASRQAKSGAEVLLAFLTTRGHLALTNVPKPKAGALHTALTLAVSADLEASL